MDIKALAEELGTIAQTDYDIAQAYDKAIRKVGRKNRGVHDKLKHFKEEHERHYTGLLNIIKSMGEKPPVITRDAKSVILKGMTTVLGFAGVPRVLRSLQQAERFTNKTYANATSKRGFQDYPNSVQTPLLRHFEDEKKHLAFIQSALHEPVATV